MRYFIVFFEWTRGEDFGSGELEVTNNQGNHFNRDWAISYLIEKNSFNNVTLTNFIELNEIDFKSYKERFERSLKVLVNPYLNDEFNIMRCECCLVGNLLADWRGVKPTWGNMSDHYYWFDGVRSSKFAVDTKFRPEDEYIKKALKNLEGCYYSIDELALIEKAGFSAPYSSTKDENNFNILMAAYDVIAEIHEVDNQDYKKDFENQLRVKL